jgi:putative glutamine amidotransferase
MPGNEEVEGRINLAWAYVQAIHEAGAIPVLIPVGISQERLQNLSQRLDGVLFSGGGDVHPSFYGGNLHPSVHFSEERDRLELDLLQAAISRQLPFFGICRGLQVINVGLGGSLYEDLLDQRPQSLRHNHPDKPRDFLAHPVEVEAGSHLARIVEQPRLEVNSLHHQGIRGLAPGLKATAYAPDGVVEAVELEGYLFGLAVQWHPECLQAYAPMRALFQSFVQAAARRR